MLRLCAAILAGVALAAVGHVLVPAGNSPAPRCAFTRSALLYVSTYKSAASGFSRRGARRRSMLLDHPTGASCGTAAPPCNPERPSRRGRPALVHPDVLVAGGAMLRAARQRRGMSIAAVRDAAGLSVGHLSLVERGKSGISPDALVAWATVLGLDPAVVLCAFRVVPERCAAAFFDPDRMRAALAGGGL
jgi:hypothetical protein